MHIQNGVNWVKLNQNWTYLKIIMGSKRTHSQMWEDRGTIMLGASYALSSLLKQFYRMTII